MPSCRLAVFVGYNSRFEKSQIQKPTKTILEIRQISFDYMIIEEISDQKTAKNIGYREFQGSTDLSL